MNNLLPVLLFCISATLTPGPNNFMILNSGMNFGVKKSMPHYLGICLGFPLMLLLVALGFGAIFTKYDWIRQALKIVGSIYMLYLSWQVLRASIDKERGDKSSKPFGFLQAVMFQWVNPKAWLMAVGAISIFTISANYFNNALAITALFLLVLFPCLGVWLLFGSALQKVLKNDKQQRIFNIIMAICLVASIALIYID